jgi:hypothetical protein
MSVLANVRREFGWLANHRNEPEYTTEFSAYGRMVNKLNEVLVRIAEVDGSRAISMGLGLLDQFDSLLLEPVGPLIDFLGRGDQKAEMVQTCRPGRGRYRIDAPLMQGQVVGSAGEVYIVRIGVPLHLQFQNPRVKIERLAQVPNSERDVPQSQHNESSVRAAAGQRESSLERLELLDGFAS